MNVERKKIYDPLLRLVHFGIAFFCLTLILSAYTAEFFYEEGLIRKSFWIIHTYSGFSLILFLMVRIVWGIVGTRYARWSELWKWQDWMKALKSRSFSFRWNWGHNPLAAVTYIIFYLILLLSSITGLILAAIEHDMGPLATSFYDQLKYRKDFLEFHESLSFFVILFIFAHLFALYWHERMDQLPVVQSMFSGYQYRHKNTEVKDEDKNE